mgnify:CR=1 FL=1
MLIFYYPISASQILPLRGRSIPRPSACPLLQGGTGQRLFSQKQRTPMLDYPYPCRPLEKGRGKAAGWIAAVVSSRIWDDSVIQLTPTSASQILPLRGRSIPRPSACPLLQGGTGQRLFSQKQRTPMLDYPYPCRPLEKGRGKAAGWMQQSCWPSILFPQISILSRKKAPDSIEPRALLRTPTSYRKEWTQVPIHSLSASFTMTMRFTFSSTSFRSSAPER